MLTRSRGVGKTQQPILKQKSRKQCPAVMASCSDHFFYHSGIVLTARLEWCFAFGPCDMLSDWHQPLMDSLPLAPLLGFVGTSPEITPDSAILDHRDV